MRLSDAGVAAIVAREGIKLKVYADSAGKPSIGIGHLIRPGETFTSITPERAFAIFGDDIAEVEDVIARLVRVPLTQNQHDALISFVFNVGEGNFASSTLLRRLNARRYRDAAEEIPRWCYARDPRTNRPAKVGGLLDRRLSEMQQFLRPD